MLRAALLVLLATFTAACVQQPRHAAAGTKLSEASTAAGSTEASVAADLTGWWDFSVDVGGRSASGKLWLFRRDDGFTGTLTPDGTNTLPVRILTVAGRHVRMTVDSAEGAVLFDGTLAADARSMSGTVIYHQGQRFALTAHKRT